MNKEEKKTPVKAIAKTEIAEKPAKPVKNAPAKIIPAKNIPAKNVPAVHVLTTFDDLMDNFRRNFIQSIAFPESIAFPWDWIRAEPIVPVREATVDLVDEGKMFVVHAELPGVAKDKIDVALTKMVSKSRLKQMFKRKTRGRTLLSENAFTRMFTNSCRSPKK